MSPDPSDIVAGPPETITLSEEAWAAFVAAIENPPPPNEKLLQLLRDYKPTE